MSRVEILRRVHLVYPSGRPDRAPESIGWHVARRLRSRGLEVIEHAWDARYRIPPDEGAVLLGHPHPDPRTVYRRSVRHAGWWGSACLMPINGDIFQRAFACGAMRRSDAVIGISGPEWAGFMQMDPLFSPYIQKARFLDMGSDPDHFRMLPNRAVPPSERGVVFVGHSGFPKSPALLEEVRRLLPEVRFGWVGRGSGLSGFDHLGALDIAQEPARRLLSDYHIVVNVSHADANPTVLLEGMLLGLMPVSTRHSGWSRSQGVVQARDRSPREIARAIAHVQIESEASFCESLEKNRSRAIRDFSWERFEDQLWDVIHDLPLATSASTAPQRSDDLRIRAIEMTAHGISRTNFLRWELTSLMGKARSRISVVERMRPVKPGSEGLRHKAHVGSKLTK